MNTKIEHATPQKYSNQNGILTIFIISQIIIKTIKQKYILKLMNTMNGRRWKPISDPTNHNQGNRRQCLSHYITFGMCGHFKATL